MSAQDIQEAYPTYVIELAEAEANVARLLAVLREIESLDFGICGTLARAAIAKTEGRQ